MNEYSDKAFEYLLLLEAGLIEVVDVIKWADQIMSSCGEYDDKLANICLAENKSTLEVQSLLKQIIRPEYEWDALRKMLGKMYSVLKENPERAGDFTLFLESVWVRNEYQAPKDLEFIVGIDDEFRLAVQGVYGTKEQAIERLINNLSSFNGII